MIFKNRNVFALIENSLKRPGIFIILTLLPWIIIEVVRNLALFPMYQFVTTFENCHSKSDFHWEFIDEGRQNARATTTPKTLGQSTTHLHFSFLSWKEKIFNIPKLNSPNSPNWWLKYPLIWPSNHPALLQSSRLGSSSCRKRQI